MSTHPKGIRSWRRLIVAAALLLAIPLAVGTTAARAGNCADPAIVKACFRIVQKSKAPRAQWSIELSATIRNLGPVAYRGAANQQLVSLSVNGRPAGSGSFANLNPGQEQEIRPGKLVAWSAAPSGTAAGALAQIVYGPDDWGDCEKNNNRLEIGGSHINRALQAGQVGAWVCPQGSAVPFVSPARQLWNFEAKLGAGWLKQGDARRWNRVCTIMSNSPAARIPDPEKGGHPLVDPARLKGDYWIVPLRAGPKGCLIDTRNKPAERGTLVSPEFEARGRYLELLLGAGCGERCSATRVELRRAGGAAVVARFNAPGENRMKRMVWDLKALRVQGQKLRIAIVDESKTHGVAVDEIWNTDQRPREEEVPMPLFGFVDLHTHPFNQIGFGGKLFAGSIHSAVDSGGRVTPNQHSDPKRALGRCNNNHGWAPDRDGVTTMVPEMGHSGEGWPSFRGWPRFTSKSHQQMYVDWIKRAWKGGLRLMHVDVGNSWPLAKVFDVTSGSRSPNPYDSDEWNVARQVNAAKAFALLPDVRDWLAIASTPGQARDIIAAGKLALVLGVEVDDPGDFTKNRTFMALARRAERGDEGAKGSIRTQLGRYLDGLRGRGVRHVFPIHISDNAFGGAAITEELFLDMGNYLFSRLLLGYHPHPAVTGAGFSVVREAAKHEGIFNRLDVEYRKLKKMIEEKLALADPVKMVERYPWTAFIPAVMPIVIAIVPAVGVLLPFLTATVTAVVNLLKKADAEFGLTKGLAQRLGEFPHRKTGHDEVTVGHANAHGLSVAGRIFIEEAMKRGMVIDISHMSELSVNQTLDYARRNDYPVIASHTGFRETGFGTWKGRGNPDQFGLLRSPERDTYLLSVDWQLSSRRPPKLLTTERSLSPRQVDDIRSLGGLVGVGIGNQAGPIPWPPNSAGPRPDCDGSSKAFIPNYLYAVDKLAGVGIALGTDMNGLAGATGPRFGTYACHGAVGNPYRPVVAAQAAEQLRQRNAVVYEVKIQDRLLRGYPDRFGFSGAYSGDTLKGWMALGMFRMGKAPPTWGPLTSAAKPYGCDPSLDVRGLMRDVARMAWGFRLAADNKPRPFCDCAEVILGNCPGDTLADVKAAWDAYDRYYKRRQQPQMRCGTRGCAPASGVDAIMVALADFDKIAGTNTPLEKSFTGDADFDFNVDGLAHYGMLPDMIQDIKNAGVTPAKLAPLFQGAEDYIRMWEKIEARRAAIGQPSGTGRPPGATRPRINPLQGVPTDLRALHRDVGRYFLFAVGFDHNGGDYRMLRVGKASFVPCAQACQREARCKAFTWLASDGRCYLKSQVNRRVRRGGYVTGSKRAAPLPTAPSGATRRPVRRPSLVLSSRCCSTTSMSRRPPGTLSRAGPTCTPTR